jgi:hypothetical protein
MPQEEEMSSAPPARLISAGSATVEAMHSDQLHQQLVNFQPPSSHSNQAGPDHHRHTKQLEVKICCFQSAVAAKFRITISAHSVSCVNCNVSIPGR